MGHDRGDPVRPGPPARIEHQQLLHDVLVDRGTRGREDVDIVTPYASHQRPELTIGDLLDLPARRLARQRTEDSRRESTAAGAG